MMLDRLCFWLQMRLCIAWYSVHLLNRNFDCKVYTIITMAGHLSETRSVYALHSLQGKWYLRNHRNRLHWFWSIRVCRCTLQIVLARNV